MPVLLISQVHGSWSKSDGYVAIPSRTTLHLFQEPGNVMINTQADWGAVASAQKLADLPEMMKLFEAYAREVVDEDLKREEYWINNIAFNEPGFEEQLRIYIDKLKQSVANLKSLAVLPLIEDDIIYDYKISSLTKQDQVFDAGKPGDPSVTRIRSAILGKVSDTDVMFAEGTEKHLSDYLKDYQGWDIYWFACQYGAATQPDKETQEMLDETNVKLVTDSGILSKKKSGSADSGQVSTWTPNDTAIADIHKLNRDNVKKCADKGILTVAAGDRLVLIGDGHTKESVDYVNQRPDVEKGTLTVRKAGAFSKGGIEVRGLSAKKSDVQAEIDDFSDKKVTFA